MVAGLLTAIAALVSVNPVGTYGPSDPGNASAGAGAVWYLAFLDGAQRLVPSGWEFEWMDRTVTLAILVPVAVSGLFLVVAALWPFVERFIANDPRPHLPLDRPRNAATRTALGVAAIVFYGVLWAAAGADTIAYVFHLGAESLLVTMQLTLIVGPPLAFSITRRICLGLQRKDRDIALHGYETGRIVRMPGGAVCRGARAGLGVRAAAADRPRGVAARAPATGFARSVDGDCQSEGNAGTLAVWMTTPQ